MYEKRQRYSLVGIAALVLGTACAEAETPGICMVGETQHCTCVIDAGRVLGAQLCEANETWGECVCGDAPRDGGMRVVERDGGVVRDAGTPDAGLPAQCTPVQTLADSECAVVSVAAGAAHTCVLRASGEVNCFGDDVSGQLGRGDVASPDPEAPWALEDVVAVADISAVSIAASDDYTCLVDDEARGWCFGSNTGGKLGAGMADVDLVDSRVPVRINGVENVGVLSLGRTHACALPTDANKALCWGANDTQQLGRGVSGTALPSSPDPEKFGTFDNVAGIAAGDGFTCVFVETGMAYCAGRNSSGQIGDGVPNRPEVGTPVAVRLPTGRQAAGIVAGAEHACALLDDTTVWCWGSNVDGQIGADPAVLSSAVPIQIEIFDPSEPLTDVVELSAGARHTCARRTDGSVVCWGDEVPLCDPFGSNKPVRPRTFFWYGTSARTIAAGAQHTCALRGDRRVHCYGNNTFGQSFPSMPSAACEHDDPVGILKPGG